MRRPNTPSDRIRALCLALPGAVETLTWGEPHFRIDGKIFAGLGEGAAGTPPTLGVKSTLDEQQALIAADDRFFVPPYVGKKGWVGFRAEGTIDWAMIETLIERSYRFIAKKSRVRALDMNRRADEKKPMPSAKPRRRTSASAAPRPKKKDRT